MIKKIFVSDIECYKWVNYLCSGVLNIKTGDIYFFDDVNKYLDFIFNVKNSVFYFHNLSYDLRVILNYIINRQIPFEFAQSGSKIIFIKFPKSKIEFRDTYSLMDISLEQFGENIGVEKKKIDYDNILDVSNEKLKDYLYRDLELTKRLLELISKKFEIDFLSVYTISQIALRKWKEILGKEYESIIINDNINDFSRKAYYGGRVEIFKRRENDCYYYDVNSLYPYMMKINKYPVNNVYNSIDLNPFGLYEVEVEVDNRKYVNIPVRIKDIGGASLFFPKGKFKTFITGIELLKGIDKKIVLNYRILNGIVFKNTDNLFEKFINKYYFLRLKDKQFAFMYKKLMNSLSGKFAQNIEKEIYVFDGYNKTKRISYVSKYPVFLSTFITSFARCYMFDFLEKYEAVYTDTDSIITKYQFPSNLISSDIGKFKCEAKIKEFIAMKDKFYAFIDENDNIVTKMKGLKIQNNAKEDFDKLNEAINKNLSFEHVINRLSGIKETIKNGQFIIVSQSKIYQNDYIKRRISDDGENTETIDYNELEFIKEIQDYNKDERIKKRNEREIIILSNKLYKLLKRTKDIEIALSELKANRLSEYQISVLDSIDWLRFDVKDFMNRKTLKHIIS